MGKYISEPYTRIGELQRRGIRLLGRNRAEMYHLFVICPVLLLRYSH